MRSLGEGKNRAAPDRSESVDEVHRDFVLTVLPDRCLRTERCACERRERSANKQKDRTIKWPKSREGRFTEAE